MDMHVHSHCNARVCILVVTRTAGTGGWSVSEDTAGPASDGFDWCNGIGWHFIVELKKGTISTSRVAFNSESAIGDDLTQQGGV